MTTIHPWQTTNVVPLPTAWCNRYRLRDGRFLTDPCPAVLIQERAGVTRVVFATFARGVLFPAIETTGFEESSPTSGPRRTDDIPPWEKLDEKDPAQQVGTPVIRSFVNGVETVPDTKLTF